jgi:hypothetical protein
MAYVPPFPMNRRSLYAVGALTGGAIAAYILGKPALRKDLRKSESAEDVVDAFGSHLTADGKKLMRNVRKHGGLRGMWHRMAKRADHAGEAMQDAAEKAELLAEATDKPRRSRE